MLPRNHPAMARESWPDVRGVGLYVFPMRWGNLLGDTVGHLQQVRVPGRPGRDTGR